MIKVSKYIFTMVVIIVCQITIMSCAFAKDRTFKGKVIDADTKEPIESAVVVAIWYEERATVAGGDTRLKDVKEVLTGKSGEWSIVGPEGRNYDLLPGLSFLTGIYFIREPIFIIFKPGYCSWPQGFSIDACKGKIKHSKLREIKEGENIELGKLMSKEDRLKAYRIGPIDELGREKEFWIKQKEFIRLLNQEGRYLGLEEYKLREDGNDK